VQEKTGSAGRRVPAVRCHRARFGRQFQRGNRASHAGVPLLHAVRPGPDRHVGLQGRRHLEASATGVTALNKRMAAPRAISNTLSREAQTRQVQSSRAPGGGAMSCGAVERRDRAPAPGVDLLPAAARPAGRHVFGDRT